MKDFSPSVPLFLIGIIMLSVLVAVMASYLPPWSAGSPEIATAQGKSSYGASDSRQWNEPQWTQDIAIEMGWKPEVVTQIGTRCDLLSPEFAIEVEWPKKCFEAVGQSLHYADQFSRKPSIMFLLKGDVESQESQIAYCNQRIASVAARCHIEIMFYDTENRRLHCNICGKPDCKGHGS